MTQVDEVSSAPYEMPYVLVEAPVEPEVVPAEPAYMEFTATAYVALCDTGCTGVTATGIDVRNAIWHDGKRIIAVDPGAIPLGSTVEIRLSSGEIIEATAQDTGGAIDGHRLDLLVQTEPEAWEFGRQTVELRII